MDDEGGGGGGEEGAPAWMATFADLMSLLLTFFVLLLSFASVDVMKFEGMIGSFRDALGVQYENPGMFVALKDEIIQLFDREAMGTRLQPPQEEMRGRLRRLSRDPRVAGSVEVLSGKNGTIVRVEGDLLFGPGKSTVSPMAFAFLDEMGAIFRQFSHTVGVEGHTDGTPVGDSQFENYRLSSERALSVLEYLVKVGGIDPQRIYTSAYGDTKPVRKNDTLENRSKNRRVEFHIERLDRPPQPDHTEGPGIILPHNHPGIREEALSGPGI